MASRRVVGTLFAEIFFARRGATAFDSREKAQTPSPLSCATVNVYFDVDVKLSMRCSADAPTRTVLTRVEPEYTRTRCAVTGMSFSGASGQRSHTACAPGIATTFSGRIGMIVGRVSGVDVEVLEESDFVFEFGLLPGEVVVVVATTLLGEGDVLPGVVVVGSEELLLADSPNARSVGDCGPASLTADDVAISMIAAIADVGFMVGDVESIRATRPATCGAAIEVPLAVVVARGESIPAETMLSPGAKRSRQLPTFENDARASEIVDAPTMRASAVALPGDVKHASFDAFPAAPTTTMPSPRARVIAELRASL